MNPKTKTYFELKQSVQLFLQDWQCFQQLEPHIQTFIPSCPARPLTLSVGMVRSTPSSLLENELRAGGGANACRSLTRV